ncbi:uncharacterized protein BCR38DRAFT_409536 [Pseudomassariella vexata]|uniref:Transmembrane protein n=1 Tax=Pseudomassariella vexata TaxID=1141098 RepID=A0A1Y2DY54_9PEZI|nr:uncharacterized protein BCR38DRAFT_409536 [Pseudomassariella vexata]ORY64139.1 hypothetical protein BCR38DRAFT_409536 [Pseudomassariella vexata]
MVKVEIISSLVLLVFSAVYLPAVLAGDYGPSPCELVKEKSRHGDRKRMDDGVCRQHKEPRSRMRIGRDVDEILREEKDSTPLPSSTATVLSSTPTITPPPILPPSLVLPRAQRNIVEGKLEGVKDDELGQGESRESGNARDEEIEQRSPLEPTVPAPRPLDPIGAAISSSLTNSASLALASVSSSFLGIIVTLTSQSSADVASISSSFLGVIATLSSQSSADVAAVSSSFLGVIATLSSQSSADVAAVSTSLGSQVAAANAAAAQATSLAASLSASVASLSSSLAAITSASANASAVPASSTSTSQATASADSSGVQSGKAVASILTIAQFVGILVGTIIGSVIITLLLVYCIALIQRKRDSKAAYLNASDSPTSQTGFRSRPAGDDFREDKRQMAYPPQRNREMFSGPTQRLSRRLTIFDERPLSGGETAGFGFDGMEFGPSAANTTASGSSPREPLPLALAKPPGLDGEETLQVIRRDSGRSLGRSIKLGDPPRQGPTDSAVILGSATSGRSRSLTHRSSQVQTPLSLNPPNLPPPSAYDIPDVPISWGTVEFEAAIPEKDQQQQRQPSSKHMALVAQRPYTPPPSSFHSRFSSRDTTHSHRRQTSTQSSIHSQSLSQHRRNPSVSPISVIFPPPSPAQRAIAISPISPPPSSPLPPLPSPALYLQRKQAQQQEPTKRQRAPVPAALQRFLPDRTNNNGNNHVQSSDSAPAPTSTSTPQRSPLHQATFSLFPKVSESPSADESFSQRLTSMRKRNDCVVFWPGSSGSGAAAGVGAAVSTSLSGLSSPMTPRSADTEGIPKHPSSISSVGPGNWATVKSTFPRGAGRGTNEVG